MSVVCVCSPLLTRPRKKVLQGQQVQAPGPAAQARGEPENHSAAAQGAAVPHGEVAVKA